MKKISLFLLFIFLNSLSTIAQLYTPKLEEGKLWRSYSSVITSPYGGGSAEWKSESVLLDGKIDLFKVYNKGELRSTYKLIYDEFNNVAYEINVFDMYKGNLKDTTISMNNKYNSKGQLVEDWYSIYEYNNEGQLVRQFSKKWLKTNHKQGWISEYTYNAEGNIEVNKHTIKLKDSERTTEIDSFVYNNCNDIAEIKRNSDPPRTYPIIMIGGRGLYQHEWFEYEYNEDCIWVKKYLIVEGKKRLLQERILNKRRN